MSHCAPASHLLCDLLTVVDIRQEEVLLLRQQLVLKMSHDAAPFPPLPEAMKHRKPW